MTTGDRKLLLICQLCLRIRFPRAKITVQKGGFFNKKNVKDLLRKQNKKRNNHGDF